MGDAKTPDGHLEDEFRRASKMFDAEYRRRYGGWQFTVGKHGIHAPVYSGFITLIYVLFNLACFIMGVIFIFFNGAVQTLGISLVVGGLFSFGAFVAQFWAVAVQRENEVHDRAFDKSYKDIRYTELQRLAKMVWELSERIERSGNLFDTA